MWLRVLRGFVGLILVTALVSACVASQQEHAMKARRLYEECLAEHPRDPEICNELRENAKQAFSEYESQSQRMWHDPDGTRVP